MGQDDWGSWEGVGVLWQKEDINHWGQTAESSLGNGPMDPSLPSTALLKALLRADLQKTCF